MIRDLKYLPHNYKQLIAAECNCSKSLVKNVRSQIEKNNSVIFTSKLQIKILRTMYRHIDEAKQAELLTAQDKAKAA